jgi:hypothetical protein
MAAFIAIYLGAELLLRYLFYFGNEALCQSICLSHGMRLGVDATNTLSVLLAEVYPALGKVDLHAVNIVDLFA